MLPLRQPSQLVAEPLARKLLALSEGNLGALVTLLTSAAIFAVRTGGEQINDHVLAALGWVPLGAPPSLSALFEHGLSGRLWPIHGKPYPDELLSSWLMRLIRAYGADPHRFCAHVWPGRAVWSRDIDQGCDAAIFRVLTTKTATHPPRVLCTTLRGYPGYTKAYGRAVRQPPWVLHGGWGTWQRQQPWLQYCPHCLQEDADPTFDGGGGSPL